MFRVLYIPNQDFNGNDTFNFKARDIWNADSSIQVAEVKVIAVPDSPIPQNRTYRIDEDTELLFTLETVDPDSPLSEQTVMILSLPTKGALFTPSVSNGSSWDQIRTIGDFFPRDSIFKYSTFPNLNGADSLIFAANDGYTNSTLNGTISFNVDPVNVYEDTEALFLFDVFDVDGGDKLSVKITSVDISGALYSMDIQRGTKVLLGEGSEVRGPPYQFYYVPPLDYYTKENQTLQHFNITYTDGVINDILSHRVSFSVLPVNDPPVVLCSPPEIFLPTNFIIGAFSNFSFYLQASDVDSSNITFVLTSPPRQGVLKTSKGRRLGIGSTFNDVQLTFDGERSGGGYPYSNFTVYAIDAENLTSQHCTYHFAFTCPQGLYNNIFSNGKGEICEPCPQGATCNTDGKLPPIPQYGWWKSGDNNTFLACSPMDACPGTAENTCGHGYRGVRCADCQQNYYRLGAVCRECRMINVMPTVIAFILFSGIVLLFYLLQRSRVYRFGFALTNILINFLQTIWVLRKVRLDWPPELLSVLDYFNVLNFNLEFVSPECIIQSPLNFSQKLRIVLALPLVLLIVTIFLIIISTSVSAFGKLVGQRHQTSTVEMLNYKEKPSTNRAPFGVSVMKMFNASLSILYVHLAGKSLSLFDCTFEEDGKAYLDDEVSLVCYTDWWYQDLPFGVASIIVYVVGIPMYFGILCVLYYQTKFRGEFWDKWKRISRGILHGDGDFKPEFQHFIILQLLQKLAIVAISIFFSRYTGLQIVLTIISLLASHMSYSKYNPYVHQTLNSLEKLSVLCSILVLAFGLPFRMDDFRFGNYRIGLVVIILCIIFGFIVGVLGVALNDVRKAISKRRMSWRQSTIKDQANS
ncbi:hypothetical protein BKA69DRAFT_772165 [Paraphysoderma sedebokerense]|nr:hypothetical protein BKA69DRAFT_772165 [Paraphysoderma sedebokerense]